MLNFGNMWGSMEVAIGKLNEKCVVGGSGEVDYLFNIP